jgi:curved DNA-binding protein CbpA
VRGVDYYELLGVERGASGADIRSAYRTLAKVMHPDAGGTSGTFRLLQDAYETLKDPARRAAYDSGGRVAGSAPPSGASAWRSWSRPSGPRASRGAGRRSWSRGFGEDPDFVPPSPSLDPDALGWWWTVDADERVRHLPPLSPGRTPVLVALGVGVLLALPLAFGLGLAPLLVAVWLLLAAAAAILVARLTRRYLADRRTRRAALAEFGDRTVFGQPGTEQAQVGERITAELVETYLTRLPGVRIFHGLSRPGSVFADIDHAVLCGRRLVLIESKMWLPGHYTMDLAGRLWRNGHPFRGGTVQLAESVAAYRALLPDVEVRGVVLAYPSRAGEITVDEPAEVLAPPMTPHRFVQDVGGWLAGESATVHRDTLRVVLRQVVAWPQDRAG